MKYISICSGIEAASTAWHGLGWQPLAFSEIDAFPSAVLAERHPSVPNLGDMSKFREWPEELLADCELLVGGTPCQAFSVAGLRKSLDDDRGNLSLVYVQLFHHINEIRRKHGRSPAIALWENVPGVLSTKDNAFGCFISGLLGVDDTVEAAGGKWPKAGFLGSETVRVGYRVLDAQYFAVAQRRRRVFLVAVPCELIASLGDRACPSEILSLRESVLGNPPTRGEARQAVAGGSAKRAASGGNQLAFGGNRTSGPVDVATSCLANGSPHGRMDFASETFVVDPGTVAFKPGQSEAAGGTFVTEEFAPTIQAQNNGSTAVPAVAFKPSHYTRGKDGKPDEVTPPLSADADKGDQDTLVMGINWQGGSQQDQILTPDQISTALAHSSNSHGGHYQPKVAVPFTKSKRAQSENDDESWVPGEVAPTQNQFDVGDTRATTVVAYDILGTLATNGGKETDCHTALRSRPPGQSEASTTTVVAVDLQNVQVGGDLAGTLDTTRPSRGGGQAVAFAQNQLGEVRINAEVMGTVNTNQNASGRNTPMVQQAMAVRRLTPTECCRLQGFPDEHCDITFRKKPAADGPKYRALGNSMAVPCMAWLGWRIHVATGGEK